MRHNLTPSLLPMQAYSVGELSEADIRSRLDITNPTDMELIPGVVTVKYSGLSQRGFYPDDPHKANQDAYLIEPAAFGPGKILAGVFDGQGAHKPPGAPAPQADWAADYANRSALAFRYDGCKGFWHRPGAPKLDYQALLKAMNVSHHTKIPA